jgi:hypothetical protein
MLKKMALCHFVHHKSHMNTDLGLSPGPRGERSAPNALSHGTVFTVVTYSLYRFLPEALSLLCQHVTKGVRLPAIALTDSRRPSQETRYFLFIGRTQTSRLKANSHMPCHAHAMPCRVNSHMPCRASAILRQCRVLRESPRRSRKYPNC